MKNFFRVDQGLDVSPLALALRRSPALWSEDTAWRDTFPARQHGVDTLMLRFLDPAAGDRLEHIDYPHYSALPEARPLITGLMARVGGVRLGICFINKIAPGGEIGRHIDPPQVTGYYDRFHIVLAHSAGSLSSAGDEEVHMTSGEVWWFDSSLEHGATNAGDSERIHLVVDIRLPQRTKPSPTSEVQQ